MTNLHHEDDGTKYEIEQIQKLVLDADRPLVRRDLEFYSLLHTKAARRSMLAELEAIIGYDLSDIKQRDQFRRDLEFIRTLRSGTRTAGLKVFTTILGILATATVVAIWEGSKRLLQP